MNFQAQVIPGLVLVEPKVFCDERGVFVKTFHEAIWREAGIHFVVQEEFYSTSRAGVLRGMHFQVPPQAHDKIVTCLHGAVLDVVVDLRVGSPTFGRWQSFDLSEDNRHVLFIPAGLAHGFLARTDGCLVHYKTSTMHSPENDRGIRWDSFGMDWGEAAPLVSPRDAGFPALAHFESPFIYRERA
ncbi:MAG: dTDP-4-dehydrorhamnose 3,5-epimerase [Candidatus Methylacidiphilales bacterium]